jgi:hypothetical protein
MQKVNSSEDNQNYPLTFDHLDPRDVIQSEFTERFTLISEEKGT